MKLSKLQESPDKQLNEIRQTACETKQEQTNYLKRKKNSRAEE